MTKFVFYIKFIVKNTKNKNGRINSFLIRKKLKLKITKLPHEPTKFPEKSKYFLKRNTVMVKDKWQDSQ